MPAMGRAAVIVVVILGACATPPGPSSVSPSEPTEPVPSAELPPEELRWDLVEDSDLFPGVISAMATSGRELVAGGIDCTMSGVCEPAIWTSDDGLDWNRVVDFPAGESETLITAVGYGPDGWVAFAGGFAWSSAEGQEWVRSNAGDAFDGLADGGPSYRTELEGDCCGTSVHEVTHVGGIYVAVGAVTCYDCLGRAAIWRSNDLVRWDRLQYASAFEGAPLYAVVSLPNGRLVAVGHGSALVSDDLGLTWSASPAFGAGEAIALTILGGELLAAGFPGEAYEGAYWRSSDGVTWERLAVEISLPEAIPRTLGSIGGSLLLAGETREPDARSESGFTAVSVGQVSWRQIPVEGNSDFRIWSFAEVDGLVVAAGNITGEGQHPAGVWILR